MGVRRLLPAFAVCTTLVASACSERSDTTPTAPRETPALAISNTSCTFSAIQPLINSEFNRPQRSTAQGYLSTMQSSGQYTAGARAAGFNIMTLIATGKKQNTLSGTATTGSDLTNQLILCMFDPASGADNFPSPFPVDFVPSLDRNQPGAYEVKNPTGDANAVMTFPGPTGTEFARISALTPVTGKNWSDILTETTLVFGRPVRIGTAVDPDQYEWKTIRPGISFATSTGAPGLLVGL